MTSLKRTCAALLAAAIAAVPTIAGASCVNRDDMHALQAASLQQRLMVSAFQCKFMAQYNAFVIGHQPELQRYDAALLAFFQRDDPKGMATYNSYKTHLANIAALEDAHTNTFCAEVTVLYQQTTGSAPLEPLLDTLPPTDTAYASCVLPGNTPVVASIAPVAPVAAKPATVAPAPASQPRVEAPPAPAAAPVVASVAPPAPVTVTKPAEAAPTPPPQPAAVPVVASIAPAEPVAPPAPARKKKEPTATLQAMKWFQGLFDKSDSKPNEPATASAPAPANIAYPTPAPAVAAPEPAPTEASVERQTSMNTAPAQPATPAWDPNRPLIDNNDNDSNDDAYASREERRAARRKARREARRHAREQQADVPENSDYDASYDK